MITEIMNIIMVVVCTTAGGLIENEVIGVTINMSPATIELESINTTVEYTYSEYVTCHIVGGFGERGLMPQHYYSGV